MAAKKKAATTTPEERPGGVAVKTDQNPGRKDGVAVLVPDAPAQNAGAENGQSAGNEEN